MQPSTQHLPCCSGVLLPWRSLWAGPVVKTSQILKLPGSLVAAGLKENLKNQLRGVVSIQQKLRSDCSMTVRLHLSRVVALVLNTLLGTSHREGV